MSNEREQRSVPQGAEREGDESVFGAGETPPPAEVDNIDSAGGGIDGIGRAIGPALGVLHPPHDDNEEEEHREGHGHALEGISGSFGQDQGGGMGGDDIGQTPKKDLGSEQD